MPRSWGGFSLASMRQSTSSPLTEALQPCNLHIHFQTHQPRVSCRQRKHVAPAVSDNRENLRRGREAKKSSTVAKAPQDPCPDREGGCQHQQPRKGQPGMGSVCPTDGERPRQPHQPSPACSERGNHHGPSISTAHSPQLPRACPALPSPSRLQQGGNQISNSNQNRDISLAAEWSGSSAA